VTLTFPFLLERAAGDVSITKMGRALSRNTKLRSLVPLGFFFMKPYLKTNDIEVVWQVAFMTRRWTVSSKATEGAMRAYDVIIDIGWLTPQKMRGLSVARSIVLNDGLKPSEFVIVDGTPQKSASKR
jgi:hypothetical protein